MGYGSWSDDDYLRRAKDRKAKGVSAFAHSDDTVRSVPKDEWKVHPQLDPKGVTRESRDSATHPESLSIMVVFDETGSMGDNPRIMQKGLARLMGGLLLQKGYAEHPQVLFGAHGDATCDQVPLQIGQFESDIAMENDLGRFLLEGGGGGQTTESYELVLYFAARHTSIDCWERRKQKGYLFLIGDEMPYPFVKAREVQDLIGDKIDEDISTESIIAQAREKYHIFMIRPTHTSNGADPRVQTRWENLLGKEHVVRLDHIEAITEAIALIVGITEGKITVEEGIKDIQSIKEIKFSSEVLDSLARSLASVPRGVGGTKPAAKTPKSSADPNAKPAPDASKKKPVRL